MPDPQDLIETVAGLADAAVVEAILKAAQSRLRELRPRRPGRARSVLVTRAVEMRAAGAKWRVVFQHLGVVGRIDQLRLRDAVRRRRRLTPVEMRDVA